MAKYTSGATLGITRMQLDVVRMLTEGKQPDAIARHLFPVMAEDGVTVDEKKVAKYRAQIRKWMRDPKIQNAYRELLREFMMPEFANAARKVASQVDDPNGWLANKAANDVLTRFGDAVMGKDDREIVVRVENMPALGTPDADE